MMLKAMKLLLVLQLLWPNLVRGSGSVEEIEKILESEGDVRTPEATHELMEAMIARLDGQDKTGWLDKLRSFSDAYDLSPDKCTTAYIVNLLHYIESAIHYDRKNLEVYLKECYKNQISFCFENLPTQFEEKFSTMDKISQHNFTTFVQNIDPSLTPAAEFAIKNQYANRFEAIGHYLDWQFGRKLDRKSDFDCTHGCPIKEQYDILVRLCAKVYTAVFTPASVMLYIFHLHSDKEHEMSPELVEWYLRYKVAFDIAGKGHANYPQFEKWMRANRIGLSLVERAKNMLLSLLKYT